ncbi:hypothetical protein LJB88_00795 [Erysipelotrichaceae bacterium OttesenSCG-928-M19]|nr:hypothetical protein [Erysipelotrichaceae bacterium OttesenSCG-928-M19]
MLKSKIAIISLLVLLFGCSNLQESSNQIVYNNNIVLTNFDQQKTTVFSFNDSNTKSNSIEFPKTNVMQIDDNKINSNEFCAISNTLKDNKLICLNLKTTEQIIVSQKDEHPTLFEQDKETIYYSSNFVDNNYLVGYQKSTKISKQQKMDYFFNRFIIANDYIYAFVSDKKHQEYLLKINKDDLKIKEKIKLKNKINLATKPLLITNQIAYVSYDNNNHYFNEINLLSKQINKKKLTAQTYGKLLYSNNHYYLLKSDNYLEKNYSKQFEIINRTTLNIQNKTFDYEIIDFHIKDKILYFLTEDKLYLYDINKLTEHQIITYQNKNNDTISGLLIK